MKTCPNCGIASHLDALFCQKCGHHYSTPFQPGQTQQIPPGYAGGYQQQPGYQPPFIQVIPGSHPVVAVVLLSIFIGGWAGALVNKQTAKGLLVWLLGGVLFTLATCGYGFLIVYPLALVDSVLVAYRLNRGEAVREWQFF